MVLAKFDLIELSRSVVPACSFDWHRVTNNWVPKSVPKRELFDAAVRIRGVSAVAVPSTVVEWLVRDEGVAGSNPATPTSFPHSRTAYGE